MLDLNGLEVAKTLRSKYPNIVLVFVTAFIEYAPVGYCVSAFRYLLKQKLDSDLLMVMDQRNFSEGKHYRQGSYR